MGARESRVELPGSERAPLAGARVVGRVQPERVMDVSLHLRRRGDARLPSRLGGGARPAPHLAPDDLAARYGADPRERPRIAARAARHGLRLVEFSVERRTAVLRGPARALQAAFGIELLHYEHDGERHHGHAGPVHLPPEFEVCVRGVFGLHGRPVARPHVRHRARRGPTPPDLAHYTADEIARLYDFPAGFDGRGECIGLVQLGGGFQAADLHAYFARLRLPVPRIDVVRVNGARNRPVGRPLSADAEVLLDLEVAGAVAPGARFVVYFAPRDDRGFLDAVKAAVHDRRHALSVLSMSWGHPETEWTPSARNAMNEVFHEAAALGITVCASAGDEGASAGLRTGLAVEFPASSPYVLACGGTRLLAADGQITHEVVWNDLADGFGATGGGVSTAFTRPGYQRRAPVPDGPTRRRGRGVPDVAGNADPETGYRARVDGRWLRLGGTSAVAPLWAGLVARLNQGLGRRVGFLVPHLYAHQGSDAFRPVVRGDNGGYAAGHGWNACTGLGTPRGKALLARLRVMRSR